MVFIYVFLTIVTTKSETHLILTQANYKSLSTGLNDEFLTDKFRLLWGDGACEF
jgi:hypothetical protein